MSGTARGYGRALFEAARTDGGDKALKEEMEKILLAGNGADVAALELISAELLGSFEEIYSGFAEGYNQYYGSVAVEAVSAFPMEQDGRETLIGHLERITGKTIDLTVQVDQSLIGGLILRFDGMEIDGSLRGHLQKIRRDLGGVSL